ncbi:hypothetical protein M2163_007361 [Streptomyces sp. SAI-135]|nr:hypothetical protein [Streptomyces sp. SAI-090]MDH6620253.1 hypothetical protein [Streptomyces sp. SAI-135]
MAPDQLPETDLTRHRRLREQGSLDRADLEAILDAGFVCHLGAVVEGRPMVVPTAYGRHERRLCPQGSVASRSLAGGTPVCSPTSTGWSSRGPSSSTASTTAAP